MEWKENVADERGVVKTLCAFANDIQQVGGGQVICGLKEETDEFGTPIAQPVGLEPKRFKELKNKVQSICHKNVEPPLTPVVEEYPVEDTSGRRILIFSVTASQFAHRYRIKSEGAQYYVRVNDRTQPANGLIARLLEQKKHWPPYLEQTLPDAGIDDIDWFALKEFFGRLQLPRPVKDYLEPDVRIRGDVRSLVTTPPGGSGRHVPRNFSLLLFGGEPHRFFPGAYAIFSVYQGKDKSAARSLRYELFGPIPALVRNIMQTLQLHMGIEIDKSTDMLRGRQNRRRFSSLAIQEAIVNAFVHRDYQSHEPVRVTVFSDRIQVANPGGLYDGLSLEQLQQGITQPTWRNPSLAWFMVGLDFAQNEGRGIRIILDETRKTAQKDPVFDIVGNWFTLDIPAYVRPGRKVSQTPSETADEENPFIYNAPVRGHHFIDRPELTDEVLRETLTRTAQGNVWIIGERGAGKTSLLRYLQWRYEDYGKKVKPYGTEELLTPVFIYFNVQDNRTRDDFYNGARQVLKNHFDFKIPNGENPYENFIDALKYIYLEQKCYILFLLDEFDALIANLASENPETATSFLAELNKILQGIPQIKGEPKTFSCIFTANYGLNELFALCGMRLRGSVLAVEELNLEWFSLERTEALAQLYLQERNLRFSKEDIALCYRFTQGMPYLVQRFFSIMYDAKLRGPESYQPEVEKEFAALFEKTLENWTTRNIPPRLALRLKHLSEDILGKNHTLTGRLLKTVDE